MGLLMKSRDDDNPLTGFGQGTREDIYLLQVKTGSGELDDVLYSIAHPDARDARPGMTRADVVDTLRLIARTNRIYGEKAAELADAYEKEFCNS